MASGLGASIFTEWRKLAWGAGALALLALVVFFGWEWIDRPMDVPAPPPNRTAPEKVRLERIALLTPDPVAQKNIPPQTFVVYQGWVADKAKAVLADSAQACEVSVEVTLHSDAPPSFRTSTEQGTVDPALLHRLRRDLEGISLVHTADKDVVFQAFFAVQGAGHAVPTVGR
jgi:hypothetical protein